MKKMLALLLAMSTIVTASMTAMATDKQETTGLEFGEDKNTQLVGGLLTPGEEYRFPLLIAEDGKMVSFTEEHMKDHNLRLEGGTGKDALESAKMVKVGDKYHFEVKVKSGWPAKQSEISYKLRYISKDNGKDVDTINIDFSTGYGYASDAYLDTVSEGDHIQVDEKAPAFTKAQLERLAKLNNYNKVTFAAGDWKFTANVSDMDNINLLNNDKAIFEILEKFPTADFKFVTFPAGTQFRGNAELSIDVSDVSEDFDGKFYVYRYLSGKLMKVNSQYDPQEDTITIGTNQLGRFVLTNQDIPDGTLVYGGSASEDSSSGSSNGSSSGSNGSGSGSTEKPNPDTGAGAGALIALVMLAGAGVAGFAARKK